MKESIDPKRLIGSVLRDNVTGEKFKVMSVDGEGEYASVNLLHLKYGLMYHNYYSNLKDLEVAEPGSRLLAPNGKPSNLTPELWEYVRTPQFRAWFGDWGKSTDIAAMPAWLASYYKSHPSELSSVTNSSKILDENGEPMVVYHGTDRKFDEFIGTKRGIWFADSDSRAKGYAAAKGGDIVIPVFLNIRKPAYSEYPNSEKDDWRRFNELGYDGRIVDDKGHIFNAVALGDSQVLRVEKVIEDIRKEKDALTTAIKERITDSTSREFTPRQKALIVSYLQDRGNYGLVGLERIYETACKDDAVKACCKEWKDQAWEDIVEIYGHPEKFEEILAEASKDAGYKGPKY